MAVTAYSIFDALPEADKRKWEAERRLVRDGIKRAKHLPPRYRNCLSYMCNLWFYHRGSKGYIHPGAELIASKTECSVRTAKTMLKSLREAGYIIPLAYEKGGTKKATCYAVDIGRIVYDLCPRPRLVATDWIDAIERSRAYVNRAKFCVNRAKVAHCNKRQNKPSQDPKITFDDPSDWIEVPF